MTAPEPLRLTLEEALAMAAEKKWRVDFYADGFVLIVDDFGDDIAHEDGWLSAFSVALGRPVVERDDTAELIAALEAWRAWAAKHQADLCRGDLTVPGYDALCRLMEDSDAALARVRSEP